MLPKFKSPKASVASNGTVQENISSFWRGEWQGQKPDKAAIFGHRLFVEGYPVFRKHFPIAPKKILDVGGGTGRYGVKFAQEYPHAKVYVTDILEESLAIARSLIKQMGVTNIEIRKEDVNLLSFPDDFFDVVFCDVVIQHLPNAKNAMQEMRRVLKPGGLLIVSVNNKLNPHTIYKFLAGKSYRYGYEKSYTRKELRDLFLEHQLDVIAVDGFYPAYGVYRWGGVWRVFGKILNRLNRYVDPWTGRLLSRYFGFEIFCVGRK